MQLLGLEKGVGALKYKIGDVSRILGISTDLLRYYEKKGVVTPEKNKSNDYRYYDAWDINYLLDCLWFKNFGFSIEETAEMVRADTIASLQQEFLTKEDELRETIKRSELLLRRSEQYRADLEKAERLFGVCEITESPEMVCFINRFGDEYTVKESKDYAGRWLTVMPFNRRYFEVSEDTAGEFRWGFSLDRDYADRLDFDDSAPMKVIPPRRAVHTVFRSKGGKGGLDASLTDYMRDFARENGYDGSGSIFGVLLASIAEQELTGYFEAWLPIE